MLSRVIASPAPLGVRSMCIAVNQVARVMRFHVAGEPEAEKADALLQTAAATIRDTAQGVVKVERTVCKSEWAYETAVVVDVAHFGAFMESGLEDDVLKPLTELSKDGEVYFGNRVFDEL